jgi:DNA-directed RNA polymerase specialized sigma24 family protein
MILNTSEAERRFNAVLRLQKNLKKTSPGSYWFEVFEKALDLALNSQRSVSPNFYYRVVDDAKRTLRRKKGTTPSFVNLYFTDKEGEVIENPLLTDSVTPEQEVIYQQSISLLRSACSKKHRHSVAIFYSMIEGYTALEAAKKLGVSESMVKKIRSEIIHIAKTILLN